jgi:lipopolysaccharide/colanic/teichoic acid biosynthesis glycosyltransferase
MYKSFLKRTIDLMGACIGLLLLSPIFLIATLGLSMANNGKPFFFQLRPGKDGKIFKIVKFKILIRLNKLSTFNFPTLIKINNPTILSVYKNLNAYCNMHFFRIFAQ